METQFYLESLQNFCLRFDSVAPKKPSSIYEKGRVCHEEVPGYRSVIQSDQRQRRPAPGMWREPWIEYETSPKSSSDDSIMMNATMNEQ